MNNLTGYFVKATPAIREFQHGATTQPTWTVTLYPETSPEAIHATHAKLVWNAYRHHKTPEAISDAVDLPVSIVRKHLVELGFLAEPRPEPPTYKKRSDRPTWSAHQRHQHVVVPRKAKGSC